MMENVCHPRRNFAEGGGSPFFTYKYKRGCS